MFRKEKSECLSQDCEEKNENGQKTQKVMKKDVWILVCRRMMYTGRVEVEKQNDMREKSLEGVWRLRNITSAGQELQH